jgi:hypothetical protein
MREPFVCDFTPRSEASADLRRHRPRLAILKTGQGGSPAYQASPEMLVPIILRGYASIPFEIPADGTIHVSNMICILFSGDPANFPESAPRIVSRTDVQHEFDQYLSPR